jgi:hypothetical protein
VSGNQPRIAVGKMLPRVGNPCVADRASAARRVCGYFLRAPARLAAALPADFAAPPADFAAFFTPPIAEPAARLAWSAAARPCRAEAAFLPLDCD